MTKRTKPLRHSVRLSANSFKWSVLIGRVGRDDLSLLVAKCRSGFAHIVIVACGKITVNACRAPMWVGVVVYR